MPPDTDVCAALQAVEDMQAKAADREFTAVRLQEERRKAELLAQVPGCFSCQAFGGRS